MSQFAIHGDTDRGLARETNEDSIDWHVTRQGDSALAIVADGVSGFAGGEVASRLAVEHSRETICRTINKDISLWQAESARMVWRVMDALAEANAAIFSVRRQDASVGRMATTIVMALAHGENICIAHVGDSRCCRLRDSRLTQLTVDHSMAQELCGDGVVTHNIAYANVLTRTLGTERCVDPEVSMQTIKTGDVYLFCSDGLSNYVSHESILNILIKAASLHDAVKQLIIASNREGGQDNVSIVLLEKLS